MQGAEGFRFSAMRRSEGSTPGGSWGFGPTRAEIVAMPACARSKAAGRPPRFPGRSPRAKAEAATPLDALLGLYPHGRQPRRCPSACPLLTGRGHCSRQSLPPEGLNQRPGPGNRAALVICTKRLNVVGQASLRAAASGSSPGRASQGRSPSRSHAAPWNRVDCPPLASSALISEAKGSASPRRQHHRFGSACVPPPAAASQQRQHCFPQGRGWQSSNTMPSWALKLGWAGLKLSQAQPASSRPGSGFFFFWWPTPEPPMV